ncbi:MAG TPA: GGDEF domain-containing protein [Clostridia bacterium]|nr:GGDEF domain-containing protein [Clostridia bacterium]
MLKKITSINIIVFIIMGVFASAETQYAIFNAEREVTLSMIMDMYSKKIFGVLFILNGILLFNVISNNRTNQRLRAKNKRNEMLSQASNEYLYEYFAKHDRLELSEKFTHLFGTQKQLKEVGDILKNTILKNNLSGNIPKIRLPLADGGMGTFKSIGLNIHDDKGRLDFIVGKIIDISEEIEEKEKLIIKSKIDGLTGLYNAITTKELINENIRNRGNHETDALIIVDCDNLKHINDTYGHLAGDRVLKNISTGLKLTFRQNDIIGRVGGDEFCIYIKNIPSISLIKSKCDQLNVLIQQINEDFYISVSSGMALLKKESTYEELFEKADKVLYEAKKKKGIQSTEYVNF